MYYLTQLEEGGEMRKPFYLGGWEDWHSSRGERQKLVRFDMGEGHHHMKFLLRLTENCYQTPSLWCEGIRQAIPMDPSSSKELMILQLLPLFLPSGLHSKEPALAKKLFRLASGLLKLPAECSLPAWVLTQCSGMWFPETQQRWEGDLAQP